MLKKGDHKIPESQGEVFKLRLSARGQVKTKRYSILLSHKTKKKKEIFTSMWNQKPEQDSHISLKNKRLIIKIAAKIQSLGLCLILD